MFGSIAGYLILGIPVIIYLGVITVLCLLFTATISTLNKRKIRVIHMKWHPRMAYTTIVFGLVHGLLAMLGLLGL
jgi:hypothetical protein